jgi:predicted HicB family RNase H-like nuclease
MVNDEIETEETTNADENRFDGTKYNNQTVKTQQKRNTKRSTYLLLCLRRSEKRPPPSGTLNVRFAAMVDGRAAMRENASSKIMRF